MLCISAIQKRLGRFESIPHGADTRVIGGQCENIGEDRLRALQVPGRRVVLTGNRGGVGELLQDVEKSLLPQLLGIRERE